MCKICKTRFNIHEKIAAHDYWEQMQLFYGRAPTEPKKKPKIASKKSLLSRIESELMRLQKDAVSQESWANLKQLASKEIDCAGMQTEFQLIMLDYYQTKLKEYD